MQGRGVFRRIESKPGKINGYLKNTHREKPGAYREVGKDIGKLLQIRSPECALGEELETGGPFFFLIESLGWYKFKSVTEGRICVKIPKSSFYSSEYGCG